MQRPDTIEAAVTWLRQAFRPDAVAEVCAVYQLELTGSAVGTLWIRVEQSRLELAEGAAAAPDVTLRMDANDFFEVLAGHENPDLLFMADRLTVEGDLSLALLLRKIFLQARSEGVRP